MSTLIHLNKIPFEVRNFNNDFVLLQHSGAKNLAASGRAILESNFPFIDEVITSEKEIYLQLNESFEKEDLKLLENITFEKVEKKRILKLPVCFEVEGDWEAVSSHCGLSKAEYIGNICSEKFTVAMFGFLPGFVYMNGLSPRLHVPRKEIPAKRVSANSLAVGGQYLGIYSLSSPGGWQILGELSISVLHFDKLPPVALIADDVIKLRSVNREEHRMIQQQFKTLQEFNGFS